jgi:hypothetical protein
MLSAFLVNAGTLRKIYELSQVSNNLPDNPRITDASKIFGGRLQKKSLI